MYASGQATLQSNTVLIKDAERNQWLLFQQPTDVFVATRLDQVMPLLQQVEQAVEQGRWAAGLMSYEASPAFDTALVVKSATSFPLLWFGIYDPPEILSDRAIAPPTDLPSLAWEPSLTPADYQRSIEQIKAFIQAGDTYQVNYTFRLQTPFTGDSWALFTQLIQAQNAQYGAWINLPDWTVCCASPELFFSLDQNELVSRPMKGTMPRGLWYEDDRHNAAQLPASHKTRAENVMIVDMVRNDMSHIAEIGSVQVSRLFEIEQYPTLWQMTSTVRCTTHASFSEIFKALFPAASITGAPKPRTMQIIAELENTPRNIYTGSIGFIAPQRRAQFNVAIRTVLIDRQQQRAEYGVGGGIVWDSTPASEFEECCTKARILTQSQPEFSLLETMLWTPDAGFFLLDRHLDRLWKSAQYFCFSVDFEALQHQLVEATQGLAACPHRVRLVVPQNHPPMVECQPFEQSLQPARICLAKTPIDCSDPFLYHKTTHRAVYDQALLNHPGYDDVLLWNRNGEITEACRANIMIEINGEWFTPPVSSGLLPGTYRSLLLEQGKVRERVIRIDELSAASRLFLINSVRQHWQAQLTLLAHNTLTHNAL